MFGSKCAEVRVMAFLCIVVVCLLGDVCLTNWICRQKASNI